MTAPGPSPRPQQEPLLSPPRGINLTAPSRFIMNGRWAMITAWVSQPPLADPSGHLALQLRQMPGEALRAGTLSIGHGPPYVRPL